MKTTSRHTLILNRKNYINVTSANVQHLHVVGTREIRKSQKDTLNLCDKAYFMGSDSNTAKDVFFDRKRVLFGFVSK